MVEKWVELGFVLVNFVGLLLNFFRDNETLSEQIRFRLTHCEALLFSSLVILLFNVEDTLSMALTTALYLFPSLLQAVGYNRAFYSGALKFCLCLVLFILASVYAVETTWTPALRAAQVMSSIALYSIVLTLPYRPTVE